VTQLARLKLATEALIDDYAAKAISDLDLY
jgi:hypothetical protein